jgi:ATP-dependent DNA helicase PIF1
MQHLRLERNMTAQKDPEFADFLLRISGGTEEVNNEGEVFFSRKPMYPIHRR